MDNLDLSHLIYLLVILLLFVPAWWGVAKRDNNALKYALIWFVIIVALAVGWATLHPESFPIPINPRSPIHDI